MVSDLIIVQPSTRTIARAEHVAEYNVRGTLVSIANKESGKNIALISIGISDSNCAFVPLIEATIYIYFFSREKWHSVNNGVVHVRDPHTVTGPCCT